MTDLARLIQRTYDRMRLEQATQSFCAVPTEKKMLGPDDPPRPWLLDSVPHSDDEVLAEARHYHPTNNVIEAVTILIAHDHEIALLPDEPADEDVRPYFHYIRKEKP